MRDRRGPLSRRRLVAAVVVVALTAGSCTQSGEDAGAAIAPNETAAVQTAQPAPTAPSVDDEPLEAAAAAERTPLEVTCGPDPWLTGDWESSARLMGARTDITGSGNRSAGGGIDLAASTAVVVQLPGTPEWVIADPNRARVDGDSWIVALVGGAVVRVDPDGVVTDVPGTLEGPPHFTPYGELVDAYFLHALFEDPLPDTRVVRLGEWLAALVGPTTRLTHGVLGDRVEAEAVGLVNVCTGERRRIDVGPVDVIEGISPLLVDMDNVDRDKAVPEVLVTLSNADDGARLALFDIVGTLLAESEPIGLGNRWRNQLAAAFVGPNGGLEIIDVRTPHIGGTVQYFRYVESNSAGEPGRLVRAAASDARYTSHSIGSRNLDLAIVVDADRDKVGEVVVPTSDRRTLVVLDRVGEEVQVVTEIDLGGQQVTNLAAQWIDGSTRLALGTDDGRLLIWR